MKTLNPRPASLIVVWLFVLSLTSIPLNAYNVTSLVTPTPTTSPVDTVRFLQHLQLLISDEDCTLPCFLGTHPGETTAQEIVILLNETLGITPLSPFPFVRSDGLSDYEAFMDFKQGALTINYIVDDEKLAWTKVSLVKSEEWLKENPFGFAEILRILGTPTEIYAAVSGEWSTLSLTLVYKNDGVMVTYIITHPEVTKTEPIPICPQSENIQFIYAWLQNPTDDRALTEQLDPSPKDKDTWRANWPLELIADTNPTEFTEFFTQNPNGCLKALSYPELCDRGYRT